MFTVLDGLKPHAHWLLRLCLASVFIYHGSMKFMNLEGFTQMMGLSTPIAVLVAFAEVVGGIGIIVGGISSDLITRLAGLAIAPVMLGAIFMVHWGRWNFMPAEGFPAGGMEFQVVLLLIAIYFVVVGNRTFNQTS